MTEAIPGSGEPGIPAAPNGGDPNGSKIAPVDPFAGLDTGIREWLGTAGLKLDDPVKLVTDLSTKTRAAESLIGKSVQLPAADAKPEDILKVFRRLGAPDKPDGYTLSLPEGVAENVLDADFGTKFKAAAVDAGLTPTQAKGIYDFIAKGTAEQLQAVVASQEEAAVKATENLTRAFGGPVESEPFKGALQLVSRAINGLGGEKLANALKAKGILSAEGNILDDTIAVAFHEIGKRYFTEGGFVAGDGGSGGDNPFQGPADKLNWTVVHKTIKADRPRALALIAAAGKKPGDFGLQDAA